MAGGPPDAVAGIASRPPDRAFEDIVSLACVVCAVPVAAITLLDRREQAIKASIGLAHDDQPRSESICAVSLGASNAPFEIHDILADPDIPMRPTDLAGVPLRFYAGVPLPGRNGPPLGMLCVLDYLPRVLADGQREALKALARQTQYLLELQQHAVHQEVLLGQRDAVANQLETDRDDLQRRHDDLQRIASHDPLTGLLNRAALAQLRKQPEAMQRLDAAPYALAVLDIDHFKQVNDRYGHLLGDRALRAVADAIRSCIRHDDVAARYGGEEFVIILPSTSIALAMDIAERIRAQIVAIDLPFPMTVSIGVAPGDPRVQTPEQVFEQADKALYRAKAEGRNRVARA